MADIPNSPLTKAHLEEIQRGLNVIKNAEYQITLAKQAGIDVSDKEAQLADAKDKLQRLKSVYFPGM
jgi:hypothetical protein